MITTIQRIFWFILLAALQILVFNHIHLFGYATPLVYVYLLIMFPRDSLRSVVMLCGFLMGLIVDMAANTPGVASGSLTLAALLQQPLLNLFSSRDDGDDLKPSFATMSRSSYIGYVVCMVVIQQVVFSLLEAFSFFNWLDVIISMVSSSALTILIILAIDGMRSVKSEE